MSTIKSTNPPTAGSELFLDSETFLTDLSDDELEEISGGITPTFGFIATSTAGCGALIGAVAGGVAYTIWGE